MTTTLVKDSIVGDDWIRQTAHQVPIQRIINPSSGQFLGDVLTGPVRLAFCDLFELPPKRPDQDGEPKFGSVLLFTPMADLNILYEEYYKVAAKDFPEKYNEHMKQYVGLRSPFRDQAEKVKFAGYTPGSIFMTCTSKFKPPVVDISGNPIVDKNRVYPGVWAICTINAYAYFNSKNPGVAFGLQSVMIIGDDTKFIGNKGPDVKAHYSGVNVSAPIIRPDVAALMPQGANPPAPPAAIPGYTNPGGGAQRPGAPATPYVPQVHYVPPVQPVAVSAGDDEDDASMYQ